MIKKLFHLIFAIVFCSFFTAIVVAAAYLAYRHLYHINILNPQTYQNIVDYWNSGATLTGSDLLMLSGIFLIIPVNLLGWWYIYRCKYTNLIFKPLAWISSFGLNDYRAPNVNIKNLKVEEKKTIEQLVNERLELEKKKNPTVEPGQFRQNIIERIEKNRK